jgi:hypothetical protein
MTKSYLVLAFVALLGVSCAHHKHAAGHAHQHGPNCGHKTVVHNGHTDYLDAGHLHHAHGSHVDDHALAVNSTNPEQCTPNHKCEAHTAGHKHGDTCGHDAIPHGKHTDYVVGGHLHHVDGAHCDDHGTAQVAAK